ncbi:MAG: hypothetical protein U0559_05015 [Anaerolineae bacterium]
MYLMLLAAGGSLFLWSMFSGFLTTPGGYRRIKANGVEAAATILSIRDTGVTINKNPYVTAPARGTDRPRRLRDRSQDASRVSRGDSRPR